MRKLGMVRHIYKYHDHMNNYRSWHILVNQTPQKSGLDLGFGSRNWRSKSLCHSPLTLLSPCCRVFDLSQGHPSLAVRTGSPNEQMILNSNAPRTDANKQTRGGLTASTKAGKIPSSQNIGATPNSESKKICLEWVFSLGPGNSASRVGVF